MRSEEEKKELFECLSGLSQTNNLRDGIDIRKEEANIIVNEIERLNKRIEDLNTINEEHRILNGELRKELQQKENIIKELRERIIKPSKFIERTERLKLLEILDKEKQDV